MLDIVTLGNEVLRKTAAPVENIDGELASFIDQMHEALIRGKGIGLAAPQVGVEKRIYLCKPSGDRLWVFINPQIVMTSESLSTYEEGCLSIPGVYADVVRPSKITVQAYNTDGKPFTVEADNVLARVIQHEYDHLDGILFIDKLSERRREKLLNQYEKLQKKKKKR